MAKETGKGNGKGIENVKMHYWHLFYQNKGKWEKRKVKGHILHLRRKMNENNGKLKKNRGLINKNAYED